MKSKKKKNTPVVIPPGNELRPVYPPPKKAEPAEGHYFWALQPVPKFAEAPAPTNRGYLVESLEGVRTIPLEPPPGYVWAEFDIAGVSTDTINVVGSEVSTDLQEVYEFLRDHYINGDPILRFDYSREALLWAMCPPGYSRTLHIGLRDRAGTLVGFISGAPTTIRVYGVAVRMVEINFLCIRQGVRSGGLAQLLIEEVARRVRFLGIWQAIYTAARPLPHALATARYYHRALNIRKLITTGFYAAKEGLSMAAHEHVYALAPGGILGPMGILGSEDTKTSIRKLSKRDCAGACRLLNAYLQQFHLAQEFTKAEFAHMFIRPGVVYAYTIIVDGAITGFISFYSIDMKTSDGTTIRAAYSLYNVPGQHSLADVFTSALQLARGEGFDVFNCLDIMDAGTIFTQLKFTPGTGKLQYYLYNWNCAPTLAGGIGVVLR